MISVRRASPKSILYFLQLLDDDVAQGGVRAEDLQVLGDAALDIGKLFEDLGLLHAGEALQLQLDDRLRLFLG